MQMLIKFGCFSAIVLLASCGGGSDGGIDGSAENDGTPFAIADIQGRWAGRCQSNAADNNSQRVEFFYSGNTFIQSEVLFLDGLDCESDATINKNQHGTFTLTGEEREISSGNAKEVDALYTHGSASASSAATAVLDSMGTDIEAILSAQGITGDISNLTLAEIGRERAEFFTLYRVDTMTDGSTELRLGSTSGSFNGSTAALRPIILSSLSRYTKLP